MRPLTAITVQNHIPLGASLATLLAACALSLCLPQNAAAQDRYGGNGNAGLPSGNYRETCRDIGMRGDVLSARCRNRNGYYNATSLSLRDCRGGYVENNNGNLRCTGGGGDNWGGNGGWNGRVPDGNYQQSCREIDVRGDRLSARCRMREGGYNYSSLSLRECGGGRVENLNGTLQCEGAYNGGGRLPAGNYRDTCKDISARGDTLTARCRDKWGDYRISSLSLRDCRSNSVENRNGQLACRWN